MSWAQHLKSKRVTAESATLWDAHGVAGCAFTIHSASLELGDKHSDALEKQCSWMVLAYKSFNGEVHWCTGCGCLYWMEQQSLSGWTCCRTRLLSLWLPPHFWVTKLSLNMFETQQGHVSTPVCLKGSPQAFFFFLESLIKNPSKPSYSIPPISVYPSGIPHEISVSAVSALHLPRSFI